MRDKLKDSQPEELDIIERSAGQLIAFTERTSKCFSPKMAGDEVCWSTSLLKEALENCNLQQGRNVSITLENKDEAFIICDAQSMAEVIHNIVMNAIEAVAQKGCITISSYLNQKTSILKKLGLKNLNELKKLLG